MEKSLNIAMFGHKRISSREGGIEIVVEELATRIVDKGHNVVVYNRKGKRVSGMELSKVDEYKGVKIKEVLTIDKKGFAAITSSFLGAIQTVFGKYDVVHIHTEGPTFIY